MMFGEASQARPITERMNTSEILYAFNLTLDEVSEIYGRLGPRGIEWARSELEVRAMFAAACDNEFSKREVHFFSILESVISCVEIWLYRETAIPRADFVLKNADAIGYVCGTMFENASLEPDQQRNLILLLWLTQNLKYITPKHRTTESASTDRDN
jgi:hypothetical protein